MFKTMEQEGVNFTAVQVEANSNASKTPKTPDRPKSSPPADRQLAAKTEKDGSTPKAPKTLDRPKSSPPADRQLAAKSDAPRESSALSIAHGVVYGVKSVLPKTSDTIELLERSLVKTANLPQQPAGPEARRMNEAQREFIDILRGRPIAWIVGTSLGFEAVVLSFAALIFCRRDY
jgi:hypothetical protein